MPDKAKDANGKKPDTSFIQLDDIKQTDVASAASVPHRKAFAGVLAVACVVLIVVSMGFVHPSESGAWSIDWIVRTVAGQSVVESGSSPNAKEVKGSDAKSKDEGKGESGSKGDSDSSDKKSDSDSKGKNSVDGKPGERNSDSKAADGGQSTSQGSATSDGSNSVSGGSASSSGGSSTGGGASSASGGQGGSQESNYVIVTVSVTSSAVGNPVSAGGTYTFSEGATVYDALCALGLSVNAHGSSYGTYVASIGGLAEKEHGGTSGWMYSVNGATPMTACSNYVLSNGDSVVWYYVTG